MVTKVTAKLWDQLLNVLSSLTNWKEVVVEWKVLYGFVHVRACVCVCVCAHMYVCMCDM